MIEYIIWSWQHVGRQHWENVAKIVHSLFMDTPDNPQLVHVKKIVFNPFQCG